MDYMMAYLSAYLKKKSSKNSKSNFYNFLPQEFPGSSVDRTQVFIAEDPDLIPHWVTKIP